MIERGEIVPVPAVTDTYVLFGIGQRADDSPFSRYEEDNKSVELYNETQLAGAYRQFDEKRSNLQKEINALNAQAGKLTKRERSRRNELQKQITALQLELQSIDEDKALLDQNYGQPDSRRKLFREYDSLQTLAKNFNGRSYDLDNPADRLALKMNMLSALRPQALKILEEVATAYHSEFGRPLPVSSLVRPEQYQHALRRVNRNAVTIEAPPHSTGLAFDIDYRYMSVAEQNFVMAELARLKNEGRIEVIRERNANYHVFAFMNGSRPGDDLITAALEKAGAPPPEAHHAAEKSTKEKKRKATRPRGNPRRSGKRRR
jgi:DNA repair exonuclease SbcCD ATPase subunit